MANAIDFISFCAFRCNGSTLIAEIHRRIMSDRVRYDSVFEEDCGSCWYSFLLRLNDEIMPGICHGSCTDPRFTFSAGSNNTKWNNYQKELLLVIKEFYAQPSTCKRQKSLKQCIDVVLQRLVHGKKKSRSEFCGIGPMGANQFIQLSSLLGLTPLYCFNSASIMDVDLGPGVLIRKCLKKPNMRLKEVQNYFEEMVSELRSVWSDLITSSLVENTLCELWRSVNSTQDFINGIRSNSKRKTRPIDPLVIMNDNVRKESKVRDIFYFDDSRNSIQNIFHVTSACSGGSALRPCLLMKDLTRSSLPSSVHNLTNWSKNSDDKKMVFWKKGGTDFELTTSFAFSKEFKKILSIDVQKG